MYVYMYIYMLDHSKLPNVWGLRVLNIVKVRHRTSSKPEGLRDSLGKWLGTAQDPAYRTLTGLMAHTYIYIYISTLLGPEQDIGHGLKFMVYLILNTDVSRPPPNCGNGCTTTGLPQPSEVGTKDGWHLGATNETSSGREIHIPFNSMVCG